ncbi:unnamed protein product [Cylicocyclus nassatus]|uniref:Transthyretin-like family protein n=1 Tax=Cylicocyclus nassatus TaxID=53992 RepID=A0AA36GIK9_CYLNA|nr:unnamed protein product [Cylicocyclus nassatus]
MRILIFLCILPLCDCFAISGHPVEVVGILRCNVKPAANVDIMLVEKEASSKFRFLALSKSRRQGSFKISGHATDTTQTQLVIYHRCNYHEIGYKRLTIAIPQYRVLKFKGASKNVFSARVLELAEEHNGQKIVAGLPEIIIARNHGG